MASRRFSHKCRDCKRYFSADEAIEHRRIQGHKLSEIRVQRRASAPDPTILEIVAGFNEMRQPGKDIMDLLGDKVELTVAKRGPLKHR